MEVYPLPKRRLPSSKIFRSEQVKVKRLPSSGSLVTGPGLSPPPPPRFKLLPHRQPPNYLIQPHARTQSLAVSRTRQTSHHKHTASAPTPVLPTIIVTDSDLEHPLHPQSRHDGSTQLRHSDHSASTLRGASINRIRHLRHPEPSQPVRQEGERIGRGGRRITPSAPPIRRPLQTRDNILVSGGGDSGGRTNGVRILFEPAKPQPGLPDVDAHLAEVRKCLESNTYMHCDKENTLAPVKMHGHPSPLEVPKRTPLVTQGSSQPRPRFVPANSHPILAPSAFRIITEDNNGGGGDINKPRQAGSFCIAEDEASPPNPLQTATTIGDDPGQAHSPALVRTPAIEIRQRKRALGTVAVACPDRDGPENTKRTVSSKVRWEDLRDSWF